MALSPKNRAPALRARDIDRGLIASALDQAYADGQLSVDEHHSRTAAARAAVTLGELHALVSDLQLDVDLPEPTPPRSRRGPVLLLASGAVVVLAVAAAVILTSADDEPAAAEPTQTQVPEVSMPLPGSVTPIVAAPFVFDTAEGLDDFRARYLERFGNSEVVELRLEVDEDNRADIYRLNAEGRVERVMVHGGFEVQPDTSLRAEGQQTFDWALLDSSVVAGVIAGAPATVGDTRGNADWVQIDNDGGLQRISVSVEAPDSMGGRVETDFSGNPTYVSRVDN